MDSDGETEAGAGWAVPGVLMETELQPTIPEEPGIL